jgi:hypothetical protein
MAENRELALVLKLVADEFQKELRNSQGALSSFNTFIKDWRTQLAAAGTALFAIAKSTANFGEEALKGAQKAGTTVQAFAAMSHAAKMADVEQQTLINGMKTLSVNMAEAARGGKEQTDLFARLGVSVVDATGKMRSIEDVMLDVSEAFKNSQDGAEKNAASVKLFAKAWEDFLPFMNQGKDSIRAAMEEAKQLGVTLSREDAVAADKFNTELKKLDATTRGLTLQVGKELVPAFTQLLQAMQAGATGPISKVFKIEMQGLSSIFILLGHGIKETAMELEIFFKKIGKTDAVKKFWDDVLVQSRKNLNRDTDKRLHEIFQDQLGKVGGGGSAAESGGGRSVNLGATVPAIDQEKLGKAKLEIFLSQNRALEIQAKLAREAAQGANEYFLGFDRKQQFEKEDAAFQEQAGRMIVERTQFEVRLRDEAQQRERDGLVKNAQAWIDYDNQVGASTELRYDHQLELLKANMASQLQLTTEQTGQLLNAWTEHESMKAAAILDQTQLTATERETLEIQSLTRLAAINQQFSGSIVDGWALGLQRYVQDTQSAFGMGAQMAQRTAQFMEQNFRQFFFDIMDNKIKSMKDLFSSFGNFAKQIISQVMAQLATMLALKAITGGFGGLGGLLSGGGGLGGLFSGLGFNAGGTVPRLFAAGGPVLGSGNQDTVRALVTPGEGVLSRRGMSALDRLNAGDASIGGAASVTVNIQNSGRTDQPQVNYRRQMKGMIIDIIYRDPDLRQALGGR